MMFYALQTCDLPLVIYSNSSFQLPFRQQWRRLHLLQN